MQLFFYVIFAMLQKIKNWKKKKKKKNLDL